MAKERKINAEKSKSKKSSKSKSSNKGGKVVHFCKEKRRRVEIYKKILARKEDC